MNLNWNGMKTRWHFDDAIKMLEAPLSVPEGFSRCQPGPASLCCLHSASVHGMGGWGWGGDDDTHMCARTAVASVR